MTTTEIGVKDDVSRKISHCRSCGSSVRSLLSLGIQAITGWTNPPTIDPFRSPLELVLCELPTCRLVQLSHTVDPERLFRNYFYKSGVNRTMRDALANVVAKSLQKTTLRKGDIVIDIGCNDGTLLSNYPSDFVKIGFDPATNLADEASRHCNLLIRDFFKAELISINKPAKIITAVAMFYDLDEPHSFIQDIESCLANDGVLVLQMSYLPLMLFQSAFDNICHEHLTYYSLRSLDNLFRNHHLKIFDAEINDVNGGSIRLYLGYNHSDSAMLTALREWENHAGLGLYESYERFALRAHEIRIALQNLIASKREKGASIYGYAASTKGNVLLQYCGFGPKDLKAIADRNPTKWGTFCVGSNIPVISERAARIENPDFFLVLAWAFMDEFRKRETQWYRDGGRFIIPIPHVRVE